MRKKLALFVAGTRPEILKLVPVVQALKRIERVDQVFAVTAQHRDLLDMTTSLFDITPDVDLNIMKNDQTILDVMAASLGGLSEVVKRYSPDVVIAQGDTMTVFAAATVAFYSRVPFAHVEAGLRTGNRESPFPEEMNRILTSRLATLHFCPTETAKLNLLKEGVSESAIRVVGNTIVDTLDTVLSKGSDAKIPLATTEAGVSKAIVVTVHRRENHNENFVAIMKGVRSIVEALPACRVIWVSHPNPSVVRHLENDLLRHERIKVVSPLRYDDFVRVMNACDLVLTDSGGIQEEAPYLKKPVLVLRETTERPEGVRLGISRLVGTRPDLIRDTAISLLTDADAYRRMTTEEEVYGDGKASRRIAQAIGAFLGVDETGASTS